MFVTSHIPDLVIELEALANAAPSILSLVSVDGYDRVGKSHLSNHLAQILRLRLIELDDLLGADRTVDVQRLKHAVNARSATEERGCLVNGVLILDELATAELTPTHRIYVKALNRNGDWVHSDWTAASDEEIQHARREGMPIGTVYPSSLIAQCAEYHRKTWPHLSADSILENQNWER